MDTLDTTAHEDLDRALTSALAAAPAAEHATRLLRSLGERAAREGTLDAGFDTIDSPLGRLLLAATPAGIVRIGFATEDEDELLDELARRVSPRVLRAPRLLDDARRALAEYFDGRLRSFELPLDWRLTNGFRRRVLLATARIPYGQTRSYRDLATAAGNHAAVRAAGSALATNPLPIVVPCHRVLRSDGALGGYRGGLPAKRMLLALEGADGAARADR
jgi:methylated-DNA-[protein]-cysteine S-methyltransferase